MKTRHGRKVTECYSLLKTCSGRSSSIMDMKYYENMTAALQGRNFTDVTLHGSREIRLGIRVGAFCVCEGSTSSLPPQLPFLGELIALEQVVLQDWTRWQAGGSVLWGFHFRVFPST